MFQNEGNGGCFPPSLYLDNSVSKMRLRYFGIEDGGDHCTFVYPKRRVMIRVSVIAVVSPLVVL